MKWAAKDIQMYLEAKEYVDTVVMPLLPVSFSEDIKETCNMVEFTNLLVLELERQFKGRLLLLPGYTYLKGQVQTNKCDELVKWDSLLSNEGFKHILYVTTDSDWQEMKDQLVGSVLWLPYLPLENMDEAYRRSILDEHVKQLLKLLTKKWKGQQE